MTNAAAAPDAPGANWQTKQVYVMAVVCLIVGLAIGYFFRGSQSPAPPRSASLQPTGAAGAPSRMSGRPSLEQMKHMADKKAEPLLAKLKDDPNNSTLLIQVAEIYKQTHQFKDAADYYGRSLKVDPKNAGAHSDLASVLYYSGDVDGALAQLQEALNYDPKNPAALFNLGMIKWQGKQDGKGALAAWQQLLKSNPQLSAERKATVQRLMADVRKRGKS